MTTENLENKTEGHALEPTRPGWWVLWWERGTGESDDTKNTTQEPISGGECPYECQDCGKKLVDVGGYWGCLCKWGGRMPTPEMIEEFALDSDDAEMVADYEAASHKDLQEKTLN